MRRAWILKPVNRDYFIDSSPIALPSADPQTNGRKAFDLDTDTYCIGVASGITSNFGIQARYSKCYMQGMFLEAANYDSAGLHGIRMQYGTSGHYSNMTFDELHSTDPANVYLYDSDTGIYSEVDNVAIFAHFYTTLVDMPYTQVSLAQDYAGDDFSISQVWWGDVVELDPLYNLGWSQTEERVGYAGSTSIIGVDLDRVSKTFDVLFKKSWTMSFEWVTGLERDNLMRAYSIEPVKLLLLDEFDVFTHYTVTFASSPRVQEVEDDYYTITFNLKEV